MKLAEALQERADLNKRIEQLSMRLSINATVQEGEKPAEDPAELMKEMELCTERLEELIAKINLANSKTVVNGKTLTEAIAHKDVLTMKIRAYRELLNNASRLAQRATRSEIKIFSAVNVGEIQKTVDDLSKELRLTDNMIQETNWKTEL